MKKSLFYYDLPEELIAQDPLTDRSSSRLMVLDKSDGHIEHKIFRDITGYLNPGDCLVLNDTKVIPARLLGAKKDTGGAVEILLLKRLSADSWECLVRPGKKMRRGAEVEFGDGMLTGRITDQKDDGNRIVEFKYDGIFEEILDKLGTMPLPPYITHKLADPTRYQTVYAKYDGSAAAPTAGLHFTPELLKEIEDKGIRIAYVTLHVGLGTFRPVKEDDILDHKMHSEWYEVTKETADTINSAKASGGRIICVGTTSTRTIESVADDSGAVHPGTGETDIFIYPGYRFKALDALITNFHLPESTLVMLVSALAGRENVLNAYKCAVEEGYRFFSFGDAMFIH
ncbi:MAG: tRNA preQ1(34) S-adenosylmethionine ribosyltransferase-isomerase QueA [Lachnospiraceae bacterium]|nr:tRNA preQ1(34) S-adenosylmethionine ribosyltransferase-isomerase QueA [Lachnospiraceae bacterium]